MHSPGKDRPKYGISISVFEQGAKSRLETKQKLTHSTGTVKLYDMTAQVRAPMLTS
jgi:hypothetical protein